MVQLVLPALKETPVLAVTMEKLAPQEQMVRLVHKETPERMVLPVLLEPLELLV
jgi:hypothetical protein